jgi:hypothetical protein
MKARLLIVLAAVAVGLIVTTLLPPAVEVPAGYDPSFIKPRVDWRDAVSYPPTEPGNAAEQYVEIAREYYPPEGRGVRWPEGEVLPPLLELAKKGARRKECKFGTEIFVLNLNGKQQKLLPVTAHDDEVGHLNPFRNVGRALRAEGDRLYAEGKVEEAVRAYEAAVILGARLVESRESTIQALVGLAIQGDYDRVTRSMQGPVTTLYLSEGDDVKYQKWIEYYVSLDEFREKFGNKLRRVDAASEGDWTGRVSGNKTAKPEDIEFALAAVLHDEDPMMKREAIFVLSSLKEPSRRVKAVIRRAEKKDPDTYVREAASNALKRLE